MSRRSRWALIAGGSILGLALLLTIAAVFVARSGWFHEQVRQRIVRETEKATGGRVEIGSFQFDWRTLTARLNDFTIHGTEPAGAPPLLRVRSITVVLKIISVIKQKVDVQSVDVEQPQANLILHPDGTTNVPEPKVPRKWDKNPAETILDLAIGRFTVQNGTIEANSETTPWNAAGQNLRAQFTYSRLSPRYTGDISIQPLHLTISKDRPLDMGVKVSLQLEKNKLTISSARLETRQSSAEMSGTVANFSAPESSIQYNVRLSLEEIGRTLRLRSRQEGVILIGGNGKFRDIKHYLFTGNLHTGVLSVRQENLQLHDVRAQSAFRAEPDKIELNGIRLSAFEGNFNGRARISRLDRFVLEGEINRFDLQRLAETSRREPLPWNGLVSGPVKVEGRLSDLNGGRFDVQAKVIISPAPRSAPVRGAITANYYGQSQTLDLGRSFVELPSTRLDFDGTLGRQLRVHLRSTNLNDVLPAVLAASDSGTASIPVQLENGSAVFDGTVTGSLTNPQIAGHATLTNFIYSQEKIDSLVLDVTARKSGLAVQNGSVIRGSLQAQFAANVPLRNWKPDNAGPLSVTGSIKGGDVTDLLALAGKKGIPVTGGLAASGQITGSIGNPLIKADVIVTKGSIYDEPFDRLAAKIDYVNALITVANGQLQAGAKQLTFNATYAHTPGSFENGRLEFQTSSNRMALNQFQLVRQRRPDLLGTIQLTAKGSATVAKSPAGQIFQLTNLNADVSAQGMQIEEKAVGDVHLVASTEGTVLNARFESNVANSVVHGEGQWRLVNDYPGSVRLTFSKVDLATLSRLLAKPSSSINVTGSVEGNANISGPALKPELWTAALEMQRLEIAPRAGQTATNAQHLVLHNSGPIRLRLQNSIMRVENARLVGQNTNIALTGTVALKEKSPLDLRVNGTVDLALLENFDRNLIASGNLAADGTIRGALAQPSVAGRMELKNANLNVTTFPNGLSNANGVILFTGDRATIQNLTAESGGGKISATGFASYVGGDVVFRTELTESQVRVRYPEGVSTVADAGLTWTGTTQRSLMSGSVTILRTGFNPNTDFGSILARSAEPVRTPAEQTGLLGGMHFDIQVETSPDVSFQSALAQQLQAEANLRVRGTPSSPAVLGRINITAGELTFFGNNYVINQGSIAFYNPVKTEPILNIDLETRARGIDVTLTLSGPINKLNVSYRSDPPLEFSDIVALLATGRAPSSDPSIAARESGTAQSWQQMGASALIGQAIANPVAGRLQRFFGVSRIKIDPQLTGVDNNPQARLTLEQQISPDITFTYITNLTRSNPQVIRIEWNVSKQFSAVALREENGQFGLDFYYKKRFK